MTSMTGAMRMGVLTAVGGLLLVGCSSSPEAAPPVAPASPSMIPTAASPSASPSQEALPTECTDTVNLTILLQGGKPVGTGAVLVARPDEPVRIVVESDAETTLRVVGTQVTATVVAGDGLSLCASFPRGRFPVTIGGTQVASVDTSDPS